MKIYRLATTDPYTQTFFTNREDAQQSYEFSFRFRNPPVFAITEHELNMTWTDVKGERQ